MDTDLNHLLSSSWHPLGRLSDIEDLPIQAILLGRPYVLARWPDGVRAFEDRCPHRGAPLSRGHLVDGRLVCPYHGYAFGQNGACDYIPGLETLPCPAPALRRPARTAVKAGLLWAVAAGGSAGPPAFSPETEEQLMRGFCLVDTWAANPFQVIDNFIDVSHFQVVHRNSFGSDHLHVSDIVQCSDGFDMIVETRGRRVIGSGASGGHAAEDRTLHYEYRVPFSLAITMSYRETGKRDVVALFLRPETDRRTTIFKIVAGEREILDPAQMAAEQQLQQQITQEDRDIVESLPLVGIDLSFKREFHTDLDRPTVELRRSIRAVLAKAGDSSYAL